MSLRLLYLAFRRTTEWLALLTRDGAGQGRRDPGPPARECDPAADQSQTADGLGRPGHALRADQATPPPAEESPAPVGWAVTPTTWTWRVAISTKNNTG
jgi:hypothetical protein